MTKTAKRIWGIVLICIVVFMILTKIITNVYSGVPWYEIPDGNAISSITYLSFYYMMIIGGIILIVSSIVSSKDKNINFNNNDTYSGNDMRSAANIKKNGLCVGAFVVSIFGFFMTTVIIVPIISIVTAILSAVGLHMAKTNRQTGTGLGKWGLTLSLAVTLGAISYCVLLGINGDALQSYSIDDYGISESVTQSAEPKESGETDSAVQNSKKEYIKGTIAETVFTSDFLGLSFTLPDGWVFKSNDEIADTFGDENMAEQCEFMAVNAFSNELVYVISEKLPSKNVTIEQCVEEIKSGFPDESTTLEPGDTTVMFQDKEYRKVVFSMNVNDVTVKSDIYVRKEADRVIEIIMQYRADDETNIEPARNAFNTYPSIAG